MDLMLKIVFICLLKVTIISVWPSRWVFFLHLVDTLARVQPDWFFAGDRGEQLMGAIAASYTYTPVAHIQAGELSGNIDDLHVMLLVSLCICILLLMRMPNNVY